MRTREAIAADLERARVVAEAEASRQDCGSMPGYEHSVRVESFIAGAEWALRSTPATTVTDAMVHAFIGGYGGATRDTPCKLFRHEAVLAGLEATLSAGGQAPPQNFAQLNTIDASCPVCGSKLVVRFSGPLPGCPQGISTAVCPKDSTHAFGTPAGGQATPCAGDCDEGYGPCSDCRGGQAVTTDEKP